jgi:hypothetical protein
MHADDKFRKIVNEQIDSLVDGMSLEEGLSIVKNLEKSYEKYYDLDNAITPENWQFFLDALGKCIESSEFQEKCKEVNCKLYCVKYYTKLKFAIASSAENTLKFELKKYFPQLVTNDGKVFMDTFFALPFEFVSLVVRYLANVIYKEKKNNLTPQLETAQKYFNEMEKRKNAFVTDINKISQGQADVFSIAEAQELLDVKAFYEYNPLNVGTLEYIVRLFTNTDSKKTLEDTFGKFRVELMQDQALMHPSYIKYLQDIKDGTEQTYFTAEGLQNEDRDTTFDEYTMQHFFPDQYIPQAKEEKPAPAPAAPVAPQAPLTAEQPTAEELKAPQGAAPAAGAPPVA